ncbi:methyl-accepting chemotaxis protein [Desulfogranum japonicum]|uniref:methyl-accepting chemotaxis protein n=1 Tax=Desulfogranum japonicum TaxID=231447 RepID=UPI002FC2D9A5
MKKFEDVDIPDVDRVLENEQITFNTTIDDEIYQLDALHSQKTDWIIAALIPKSELKETARATMLTILAWISGVMLLAVLSSLFFSAKLTGPINAVVNGLQEIAEGEGDLTKRLQVDSQDEVGKLAECFNQFMEQLQNLITEIGTYSKRLNNSSTQLSDLSDTMSANATDTSTLSATVAAAVEEMSANMTNVAAAMEESSTNTNMVAGASEEMTVTINEISKNTEKARAISNTGVQRAEESSQQMNSLSEAASGIGKVLETITEISEQVNLLALNATIEAARAGEAGKGFAVVANEIKDLAKQTSEATYEIRQRIEGIQGSTSGTIAGIEEITGVITEINGIISGIAEAIQQQASATQEIADNISQASQGIQEVNESVNQTSSVAAEITSEVAQVNQAADQMASGSDRIKQNGAELLDMASHLNELVGRFKV